METTIFWIYFSNTFLIEADLLFPFIEENPTQTTRIRRECKRVRIYESANAAVGTMARGLPQLGLCTGKRSELE
jgi:hypothetical protein